MHTPKRPLDRRAFLAAASGLAVAPSALAALQPRAARAARQEGPSPKAPPPSTRITIGVIGAGMVARGHIDGLVRRLDVRVIGVCDVDRTRRESAKVKVDAAYGERDAGPSGGCAAFIDHRELLAMPGLDVVLIATPDHWHAAQIIDACNAGKDIYCEKPLTLTIREAKLAIDAVRKHKRVLQTGSQQRTEHNQVFVTACEYVRNGRIGDVVSVNVGIGDPSRPCDLGEEATEPGLEWDRWLGPAPKRPYNSILSPRGVHGHYPDWRLYTEYSGGMVTDWGAHHLDIVQWGLRADESGPIEVLPPPEDFPQRRVRGAALLYPKGVRVMHGGPSGITFVGTEGLIQVLREGVRSIPDAILAKPLDEKEERLPRPGGHWANFLDCVKSRAKPVCDVEVGARSVTCCHLVNLAYRHGVPLRWDASAWRFTKPEGGPDEAHAAWLDCARRDGYALPAIA